MAAGVTPDTSQGHIQEKVFMIPSSVFQRKHHFTDTVHLLREETIIPLTISDMMWTINLVIPVRQQELMWNLSHPASQLKANPLLWRNV